MAWSLFLPTRRRRFRGNAHHFCCHARNESVEPSRSRQLPRFIQDVRRSHEVDVHADRNGVAPSSDPASGHHEDVFQVYGPDDDPRAEYIREERRSAEALSFRRRVLKRVIGRMNNNGSLPDSVSSMNVCKETLLLSMASIVADEGLWTREVVDPGESSVRKRLLEECVTLMRTTPYVEGTAPGPDSYEMYEAAVVTESSSMLSAPSDLDEELDLALDLEDALAANLLSAGIVRAQEKLSYSSEDEKLLERIRTPSKWYSNASSSGPRRVTLHIGPTNSGKTYSCVEKLAGARSGLYVGPSRILAWEIRDRLTRDYAVPCSVYAGSDVYRCPRATHACVIPQEFGSPRPVDVAVVDEAQLMASPDHSWKITRAILGTPCGALHICADPMAEEALQRLFALSSDQVDVVRYQRMAPLQLPETPLKGRVESLRAGDCVVVRSTESVFRLRGRIQRFTELECSILHQRMSAKSVRKEVEAFNTGRKQVLVATDAIADGLNLNIDRIIFWDVDKLDGNSRKPLSHSTLRQIGGRAGRYTSEFSQGEVCVQDLRFLRPVRTALSHGPPAIEIIPVFPNPEILLQLAELTVRGTQRKPETCEVYELLDLLALLVDIEHSSLFEIHDLGLARQRSRLVSRVPGLDFMDRYTFALAPFNVSDPTVCAAAMDFAKRLGEGQQNIDVGLDERLLKPPKSLRELDRLRSSISIMDLYIWLSTIYPDSFDDRLYAEELREDLGRLVVESS